MAPSAQENIGGWSRDELTKRLNLLTDPQGVVSALRGYVVDFRAHFLHLLKQNPDFDPKPQDLLQLHEEFGHVTRIFLTHIRSARFEDAEALLKSRSDIDFAASHECREEIITKYRVFLGSSPKVAEKLRTVFPDFFPKERPEEAPHSPTDSSLIQITKFIRTPSAVVERELSLAFAKRDFRTCLRDGNIDGAKSAMEKFPDEDFINDEESRSAAKAGYLALLTNGKGEDANWIVNTFQGAGVDFTVAPSLMPRKKGDATRRINGAEPTLPQKKFLRALAQGDMLMLAETGVKDGYDTLLGFETAVRSGYLAALRDSDFAVANEIIENFGEGIDLSDETKEAYLKAIEICDNNLITFTNDIRYVARIPLAELVPAIENTYRKASSTQKFHQMTILQRLFANVVDFSKITVITMSPTPPKPVPDVDQFASTEARGADGRPAKSASVKGASQTSDSPENAEVVFAEEVVATVVELLDSGNIDGAFKAKANLGQNPEFHYPELASAVKRLFLTLIRNGSHQSLGVYTQYQKIDYTKELRDGFMYHIQQGNILAAERLERQFRFEFEPFDAFAIDIQAGYRICLEKERGAEATEFERRYGQWACLSEIKDEFVAKRTANIDLTNFDHVQGRIKANDEQILRVLGMPQNRDHAMRIFSQLLYYGNPVLSIPIHEMLESDSEALNTAIRNAISETLINSDKRRFAAIFRAYPVISKKVCLDFVREGLSICADTASKYIPDDVVISEREIAGAACRGVIVSLHEGRGDDAERIFEKYFDDEMRYMDGYHEAVRNGYYSLLVNGDCDGAVSFRRRFGRFTEFTGYTKAAFDKLKATGKTEIAQSMLQYFGGNLPD